MKRSAVISDCGQYRYRLERQWGDDDATRILWVMCNPSTADATVDDPTIRKCIKFSTNWGAGSMEVVNLWAYRSSKPEDLQLVPDAMGPDNLRHIEDAVLDPRTAIVVGGWGNAAARAGCANPFSLAALRRATEEQGKGIYCLGRTASGAPRHPGRLAYGTPVELW